MAYKWNALRSSGALQAAQIKNSVVDTPLRSVPNVNPTTQKNIYDVGGSISMNPFGTGTGKVTPTDANGKPVNPASGLPITNDAPKTYSIAPQDLSKSVVDLPPTVTNREMPTGQIDYSKLPDTPNLQNLKYNDVSNNVNGVQANQGVAWTPQTINAMALKRQSPLTEQGKLYEDQTLGSLQSGKFGDVESARNATNRENALRSSGALQAARGTIGRSGEYDPEAALRAEEKAGSVANASNLSATNNVNQLQRSYTRDALDRANLIENQNQDRAGIERNYLTNTEQTNYNRGKEGRDYTNSRGDLNYDRSIEKGKYADNRADLTNLNKKDELGVNNNNLRETYLTNLNKAAIGDSRLEKNLSNATDLYKFGIGQSNTDRAFNASREDQATQNSHWNTTRGDQLNERDYGRNYQTGRDKINDARWDKTNLQGSTSDFLNSITDQSAKNAAQLMLNQGMRKEEVAAKIFNPDGSLKIHGMDPIEAATQANEKEMRSVYKQGTHIDDGTANGIDVPTDPVEYDKFIQSQLANQKYAGYKATTNPINTVNDENQKSDTATKLLSGKATETDLATAEKQNLIPHINSSVELPVLAGRNNEGYNTWIKGDGAKSGGYINMNGTPVRITGSGNYEKANGKHNDYLVASINGKTYYYDHVRDNWFDKVPTHAMEDSDVLPDPTLKSFSNASRAATLFN